MNHLVCTRCQHRWLPRLEKPPLYCPFCHSNKWQTPRRTPVIGLENIPKKSLDTISPS